MFETAHVISWVFRHIRRLFKTRPDNLNPGIWICVMRNGNLTVVRRSSIEPGDYEVMWCYLYPCQLPSWLKMSLAIRKHWSALKPIALERIRGAEIERQRESNLKVRFRT
jgi:hypothetical protein